MMATSGYIHHADRQLLSLRQDLRRNHIKFSFIFRKLIQAYPQMSCLLRRNSQSLEIVKGLRRRKGLLCSGSQIETLSTNSYERIFLIVLFVFWFPIARSVRVVEDIDPFLNNVPPILGFSMTGGYLVDKGGDVNGDGIADILVADTTANSNTGVCYVVFGKKDFENTNMDLVSRATGISTGFRVTGAAVGDELGRALSTAGDINGDGIGDLVISAWKADPPAKMNAGIVYVLFGRKVSTSLNNAFVDTQLPTTALATSVGFRILGAATNDQCCNSARNAGDINGDGVDDIVLGSYNVILIAGHVQTGIAYLIFGRKVTVAANNGFSDIQLLTTALPITIGFRIIGAVSGDWFGIPVSSAGDVNGDGVIDIIIGAVLADPPAGSGSGIAYVLYGRNVTSNGVNAFGDIQLPATALASTVGFRILGAVAGDVLGASDGIGDFNGDGVSDVVVGAHGSSGEAGMAYVIYGRKVINAGNAFPDIQLPTTAMPASLGFRIIGAAALDQVGNSVRGAGDVNGDGLKDLIVGAAGANPTVNRADAGIAYVIFGRNVANGAPAFSDILLATFTASSTVGYRILGVNSNDRYGGIVAGLGDVNGDGAMDIAVGGTGALKAYVIYGTLYSPTSQPSCQPSRQPSSQPSRQPSRQPSSQPILNPTARPTAQPSQQPSRQPTMQPSRAPSGQPLSQPTAQPTAQPSQQPSRQPSAQPSCKPSTQPTSQPSVLPSCRPSSRPSTQPSCTPTTQPTQQPTRQPSYQPISIPTSQPSHQPTHQPSGHPSFQPTCLPTMQPSGQPSLQPYGLPSAQPSAQPSGLPTTEPSSQPSCKPSNDPSSQPSAQPTKRPTSQPSCQPSSMPSLQPTGVPTLQPSASPSRQPSSQPSTQPTCDPTAQPTTQPSGEPSSQPTNEPSAQPSIQPTQQPSNQPSGMPTSQPTNQPSGTPSAMPTAQPSVQPSLSPTQQPSMQPSEQPRTEPTSQPTASPTSEPTADKSTWAVAINAVLGITSIGSIYQDTWPCEGQNRSASCLVITAAGMIVARHIFPWNMVQSTIAIGELSVSTMHVSGRTITPENTVNSEVASCEFSQARLECTAWTLYSTQFTATAYVPFPKKALYVGSYLDYTSITVMDATTHTIQSYIYSFSNIKLVTLLQVQAPPGYVGAFVAGISLSVSGAAYYIVAGVVRTDTGVLSLAYYAPSGRIIVSSDDLVNTMALEYEHPDSLIAGGLLINDNLGNHAYLLRINALFGSIRYGVRYIPVSGDGDRRLLSDSFTFATSVMGMVRVGNEVYMIVDATRAYSNGTSSTTGLSVIKAEITTGAILQQVHVFSLNASISCSGITTSSTQLYLNLACRVDRDTFNAESVVISTDLRFSFSKLPAGFIRQAHNLFTAERVAFQRFSLPVTTKSTHIVTTSYQFSTFDGAPTYLPTVSPTLRPTVLRSISPSGQPSSSPTSAPSISPQPTSQPSSSGPTNTYKPTVKPTPRPSRAPNKQPTVLPTVQPSITPTVKLTRGPSVLPSTQPSPARTVVPTRKPTTEPTLKSSFAPTPRPTSAPSTIPSVELIAAAAGYREERLDSTVMILVYVVTCLTGIWCAYKMLNCYQYTLQKRKRSRKMQAELDSIQVGVADQPAHQPHLPSPRTQRVSTVTPHGAYAIGISIGANARTPKKITLQGAVQSDSGSSSVVLSSLHSSEMSDISNSVDSDEQSSEENSSFLQLPQSEESLMEEGGDQHSQGCSINGSSGGSGDDKQSDDNFAGSSVASDNAQKISESSNSDMLS